MRAAVPLCLLLAACASPGLSSDFEGGCLENVREIEPGRFRARVPGQADEQGRNRQVSWYSFRVDGFRGRDVEVTLTDLVGEYDYKPGAICIMDDTPPLVSPDGRSWEHLKTLSFDKERKELTLRLKPEADRLWVAHIEPYTVARLDRFLSEIRGHAHFREETIGETVEGRPLRLLTVTNPSLPEAGKKVVWLMVRQHAWESGTSFAGEGAVRWMLSDDPEARGFRDRAVFKVFAMMDPDGCARGGVRFNRNGWDLNRNWDSVNVSSSEDRRRMPEIFHAKKQLYRWIAAGKPVDLFLTLHNQERGDWLSGSEDFKDPADRFFRLLREGTTFSPDRDGPRPPRKDDPAPGRATVYEFLDREWGVPAFILEQGIAHNARLGRLPVSKDRLEFGARLARAMMLAVEGRK